MAASGDGAPAGCGRRATARDAPAGPGPSSAAIQLQAADISAASFAPFGQLIEPTEDGKPFDASDAHLVLGRGPEHGEPPPRLYIMRLPRRGRRCGRITYHARATQCLGCLGTGSSWYLVVAAPTLSLERPPATRDLTAFRIPPGVVIKLHQGTWHAGPLFDGPSMDFLNLENADTNVVDHNTHLFGCVYEVVD